MPKTTILEAIEKIRRSIPEGESDARDVLESVRELWDELDLGLYDRRTLAIVGLVDLVGARSRRNRRARKSRCAPCWRIS